jgi:hypothetical protein
MDHEHRIGAAAVKARGQRRQRFGQQAARGVDDAGRLLNQRRGQGQRGGEPQRFGLMDKLELRRAAPGLMCSEACAHRTGGEL